MNTSGKIKYSSVIFYLTFAFSNLTIVLRSNNNKNNNYNNIENNFNKNNHISVWRNNNNWTLHHNNL